MWTLLRYGAGVEKVGEADCHARGVAILVTPGEMARVLPSRLVGDGAERL